MITDLLTLTRPLIVLDCETTGLNAQVDRIIELAFEVHRPDGRIDVWRSLINPGIPIPPAVTKIHGITDAHMMGCRRCDGYQNTEGPFCTCEEFAPIPKFGQIAQHLAAGFSDCDFAGKKVRFDLGFLLAEFARERLPWHYGNAYIIDADRLEALAKPRHLSDLYKLYTGDDLVDAHSALADVKATSRVIFEQLKVHAAALPRDLKRLHELSWPGFVDSEGKFAMRDGEPIVAFGKRYKNVPMRQVPRDFYEQFILKGDFSDEVKHIAREAIAGRYPQ